MKKVFLLFTVVVMAVTASAQMSWNVKAGLGLSNYTGKDAGTDAHFAYRVGLGMSYTVAPSFAIEPTLYFAQMGAKSKKEYGGKSINPLYLQLPIMAAYSVKISDGAKIVFNAGPYVGFGLGGKVDGVKIFGNGEDAMGGKSFDAGLGIGARGELSNFIVGIDYQLGLTKAFKTEEGESGTKNMGAFLTLGYKF